MRPLLQGTFEAFHRRGITDILITSHVKNPWIEYAPGKSRPVLDKVKPGGRLKVWSRISTAMLWLVRPARPINAEGAPSAIVLKARAGKASIDKEADRWVQSSPVPPRLPYFDWYHWRQYAENGWNPLDPKPGETLSDLEEGMISELLSKEEYRLMILGAEIALQQEERELGGVLVQPNKVFTPPGGGDGLVNRVKELAAEGKTIAEIAGEVGKPVPIVRAMMEE